MASASSFFLPSVACRLSDTTAPDHSSSEAAQAQRTPGLWLTLPEFLDLSKWSRRTFFRRRASIPAKQIDGVLKYSAEALPTESLVELASSDLPSRVDVPSPLVLKPIAEMKLAKVGPTRVEPVRVSLTPEQDAEASRKLAIIQPLLDYQANPPKRPSYRTLRLTDGTEVSSADLLSRYLAEKNDISCRVIWNWKKAYEAEGRFALARKPRKDKHKSDWAATHRTLADLAASIYIGDGDQPGQSKRIAWEAVCARARVMGVKPPSYETIRTFLENPAEVSPSMRVMGREGRRKYDAQFAPYIRRGYTEPSNAIWVSDHAIVDTLCQNDIFGDRDLHHIRLRMTTLLDYRSRYVVGVSWCQEGSSHSIKRALLRAITRHGLPESFYCDNGKDYRAVAGGARRHELAAEGLLRVAECTDLNSSAMKRLGVPVTFCLPYHPQSKHIERYHRTFHERFDKAFRTYTGGAPHLRPDATTEALSQHGKLLQMGTTHESALPLASEYIQMAEAWIERWYHLQPHEGTGMNGRSPAQCFVEERAEGQRPTPDAELLAMLLAEKVTRKVSNCAITIDKVRLVPNPQDHLANLQMHELSGRQVIVAYDPLYPQFAAVLDEDHHFVCRLEQEQLYRMSPDQQTSDDVQQFIRNRSSLAKAVKQSSAALHERTRQAGGTISPEEALRQLAQLPAAVGNSTVHRPSKPASRSTSQMGESKQFHSEDIADWFLSQRAGGL